jgi:hypothetical protein
MRCRGPESGAWVFHPREGFGCLTRNSLRCRIAGYGNPDQPSSSVAKNDQAIEQLERDGADYEQVDRSNSCGVIA